MLWKTIISIQNQFYSNWEILLVDDRSTDTTEKLAREFKDDKRIKYLRNERSHNAAGSRNTGLFSATGSYIAYLDDDNFAYPDWISVMIDRFQTKPNAKFAYPALNYTVVTVDKNKYSLIKESCHFEDEPTIENLWAYKFEADLNGLVHVSEARDKGLKWDEKLKGYEDYDYSIQLSDLYPNGMLYVPQALIKYTRVYGEHGASNDMTYQDLIYLIEELDKKYFNHPNWIKNGILKEKIGRYKNYLKQGLKPIDVILQKSSNYNKHDNRDKMGSRTK